MLRTVSFWRRKEIQNRARQIGWPGSRIATEVDNFRFALDWLFESQDLDRVCVCAWLYFDSGICGNT
jgi:hypothetical protein